MYGFYCGSLNLKQVAYTVSFILILVGLCRGSELSRLLFMKANTGVFDENTYTNL